MVPGGTAEGGTVAGVVAGDEGAGAESGGGAREVGVDCRRREISSAIFCEREEEQRAKAYSRRLLALSKGLRDSMVSLSAEECWPNSSPRSEKQRSELAPPEQPPA